MNNFVTSMSHKRDDIFKMVTIPYGFNAIVNEKMALEYITNVFGMDFDINQNVGISTSSNETIQIIDI